MALPHLQSQGKEPWGQDCFTTIPFTYSHPTFTWMKYVDFHSLKIETTDKVNPSEIASFFFLPSETGPFPPYPSEIFQESSPRGTRVGMLSFSSFPQPCTPGEVVIHMGRGMWWVKYQINYLRAHKELKASPLKPNVSTLVRSEKSLSFDV